MSDILVHPIEGVIDVSIPLYPVLVSVPVYEVDVQTAGAPGMTGPPGPPGPPAVLPPESDAQKNTTYGFDALPTPGEAFESVAVGQHALRQATSGQATAVGYLALGAVTNATESTAVGGQVGMLATGTALTLVGHGAGYYPVDLGASNQTTLVGAYACSYSPGGGTQASALGFQSRAAIAGTALGALAQARGLYSTAVGHGAVATLDNQIMLGTAAERVYVNNDPVAALEVATKQYVDGKQVVLPPESDAAYNTGYGVLTLPALTTGSRNTSIGWSAQQYMTSGQENTAVGAEAQQAINVGVGNVGMGRATQISVTSGSYNTAIGNNAQGFPLGDGSLATRTSSYQTAIGWASGQYTAGTGNYGVGIGGLAVYHTEATALGAQSQARGVRSTALGFGAMATLDNQIMLGTASERVYVNNDPVNPLEVATKRYVDSAAPTLPPESDGLGNTSYGVESQLAVPTGTNSTAIGFRSQRALTAGGGNAAFGVDAQYTLTTGQYNVAVGTNAQRTLNGTNNTAVGFAAQRTMTSGGNNTAIGYEAQYSPRGNVANATLTAVEHTSVGMRSGAYAAGTGNSITTIGHYAVAHTQATAIGANAEARGVRSTAIGYGAVATLANQIMLGTATERVYVNNDPVAALEVATKQYVDSAAPTLPPESDGLGNTGYGQGTLPTATGVNNTAIGLDAGGLITTGIQNVAIGEDALYAPKGNTATATKTASKQVAVGTEAGAYGAGVGDGGVAIGHRALFHSGAIAIGLGAEARNSRSVAIGYTAMATIDNQIMLGASYHRVYVNNDPIDGLEVATKRYVDSRPSGGMDQAAADARYLQLTGGTLSGKLSIQTDAEVEPQLVLREATGTVFPLSVGWSGALRMGESNQSVDIPGTLKVANMPINPWVQITQAEYDALMTKDPNTLYCVVG